MLSIFSCDCALEKWLFRSSDFKSDCFLMLNSMSSYILDINALSVTSFENIFSFGRLAFSFVDSLPHCVNTVCFAFVAFAWGDRSKKILLRRKSKSVLPLFFPGNFKVSGLIFRSLIHFAFIFVYGVRSVLTLSFHM